MAARVLIVTDDPNLQLLLGQTLTGSGYDVQVAQSGADGLRRWKAEAPDLLLLDANIGGLDGYAVLERIRGSEPQGTRVAVVMLGGGDPRARVRGLQSGADDYLVVPVHPAELLVRVRRLIARVSPKAPEPVAPAMGHVLAFYGAKGGVGTTTLAVNTAIALQRVQGRRVVLVDANLQFGDHRVFLDVGTDRRSIIDAVSATAIDADLLATCVVRHESGVDLLLAPPSPEVADHVSAERHHMLQIVEVLRTRYDYVVVDLHQGLDDHSLDVIGVADRVMIVMTADLSCIKNVRLVMETMGQIGVSSERLSLLMNRSNAMTGVSAKSVEAVLKRRIEYMVVNDYRAAITALNTGKPFMLGRADAGIARSVTEMARTIDGPQPEVRPAPFPDMRPLQLGFGTR